MCVEVPASVVRVGALGVVDVSGQHVVVHVDGAAVVDGVAKPLGHDGLAGVRRQTQLEEAGLRRRQAVVRLKHTNSPQQTEQTLQPAEEHLKKITPVLVQSDQTSSLLLTDQLLVDTVSTGVTSHTDLDTDGLKEDLNLCFASSDFNTFMLQELKKLPVRAAL